MLYRKEFLKEELHNAERLLNEVLRFKYLPTRSERFYSEISNRLKSLHHFLDQADLTNEADAKALFNAIDGQSALVARIERSHVGEFSWAFTKTLERIALKVWESLDPVKYPAPLFFICADPSLGSYRIYPEQPTSGQVTNRPIYSVVFPRTLKTHVMLNPILGHELGHAFYRLTPIGAKIKIAAEKYLFPNSPFCSADTLRLWLEKYHGSKIDEKYAGVIRARWLEEVTCDLLGLLIIGPAFIGAHHSLLSLAPPLDKPGDFHPPPFSRFDAILKAVRALNWDHFLDSSDDLETGKAFQKFIDSSSEVVTNIPSHCALFSKSDVSDYIGALQEILDDHGECAYKPSKASIEVFQNFKNRVPAGRTKLNSEWDPVNDEIDFRDIVLAGWLYWHSEIPAEEKMSFYDINRFCNRSIVQQEAQYFWKSGEA